LTTGETVTPPEPESPMLTSIDDDLEARAIGV